MAAVESLNCTINCQTTVTNAHNNQMRFLVKNELLTINLQTEWLIKHEIEITYVNVVNK